MSSSARNDGKLEDVSTYFDKIDFDKLPNSFVIKTNHGSKWQYIIKDKEQFLPNKQLFETVKSNITGWLEQDYSLWCGFELQYKNITPKILIEPLMREEINTMCEQINVYCCSGMPKIFIRFQDNKTTLYDEELKIIDDVLSNGDVKINKPVDDLLNQTFVLSKQLSKDFCFVRVDWMIYQNKLYFEEFTFTPFSGFKNMGEKSLLNIIER